MLLAYAIYGQEKLQQFDAQYASDFLQRINTGVFFPSLNAAKIRTINTRIECKLLLRNRLGNANAPQILPDQFAPLHGRDGQYLKDIKPLDISTILRFAAYLRLDIWRKFMHLFARLMLPVLALSASSAQAAEPTFDLICQGLSGQQLHYRLDLAQKKWCIDQCQVVGAINQLSDNMIELVTYRNDGQRDWTVKINRYTGAFAAIRGGYGSDPKETGQCEAKPFSGFPGKKF